MNVDRSKVPKVPFFLTVFKNHQKSLIFGLMLIFVIQIQEVVWFCLEEVAYVFVYILETNHV